MKASEFIQRIQELIDANGDVEVAIRDTEDDEADSVFCKASVEPQNAWRHPGGWWICLDSGNTETVIKVW